MHAFTSAAVILLVTIIISYTVYMLCGGYNDELYFSYVLSNGCGNGECRRVASGILVAGFLTSLFLLLRGFKEGPKRAELAGKCAIAGLLITLSFQSCGEDFAFAGLMHTLGASVGFLCLITYGVLLILLRPDVPKSVRNWRIVSILLSVIAGCILLSAYIISFSATTVLIGLAIGEGIFGLTIINMFLSWSVWKQLESKVF